MESEQMSYGWEDLFYEEWRERKIFPEEDEDSGMILEEAIEEVGK